MQRTPVTRALIPPLLLLTAAGLTTACEPPVIATPCTASADCPLGYRCNEEKSYCYVDPAAGGDSGLEADAGQVEGGAVDGATRDRPRDDRSAPDARRIDTSTLSDSAALDASTADVRGPDLELPDAEPQDISVADQLHVDSGVPDAVTVDVAPMTDGGVNEGGVNEDGAIDSGTEDGGTEDGGGPRQCPDEWWNSAWPYRRLVTLQIPTEELDSFVGVIPVAIAFDNSAGTETSAMTQPGLRVVGPSNNLVAHDVELWETGGRERRIIWTRLSLEHRPLELCLYYTEDGNDPDTSSVSASAGVWSPYEYRGVWHFTTSQDQAEPFLNSLQDDWDLSPSEEMDSGKIGYSAKIGQINPPIAGESADEDSPELAVSFWLRVGSGTSGHLVGLATENAAWRFSVTAGTVSNVSLDFVATRTDGTSEEISSGIRRHQWVHVALVRKDGGMELYIDGLMKHAEICGNVAASDGCDLPVHGSLIIGEPGATDGMDFDIDELRIAGRAVAPARILADRAVTNDPFGITSLGQRETPP